VEATLRVLIRRILVQILAAYLVLFVLAVACFWILNSLQQNRISRSLTLVTRESLVVRDLRQVIINLDQFVGNQFYSVSFFDSAHLPVFVLPASAGLAPKASWNHS
jgi:uncharacterized protein (DUF58 family)